MSRGRDARFSKVVHRDGAQLRRRPRAYWITSYSLVGRLELWASRAEAGEDAVLEFCEFRRRIAQDPVRLRVAGQADAGLRQRGSFHSRLFETEASERFFACQGLRPGASWNKFKASHFIARQSFEPPPNEREPGQPAQQLWRRLVCDVRAVEDDHEHDQRWEQRQSGIRRRRGGADEESQSAGRHRVEEIEAQKVEEELAPAPQPRQRVDDAAEEC
mmetsp:Transcript_20511/g.73000  ORF Transcript_20511/g.73000 Transcript_20511/m.73000 type:complete len:217 (-) Transcript_20511:1146-1796(-)